MVGITLAPPVEVGIFCVAKKSGQLRLIIDARCSNQHFKSPPSVALATSESFSKFECPGGGLVFISTVDVAGCFHIMRMPPWLTRYFCLPSLTAAELGLTTEMDRVKVEGSQLVRPCCLCLSMGFSWSLYFAQSITESVSGSVPAMSGGAIICDARPGQTLTEEVQHYVYVDNIGALGYSQTAVDTAMSTVIHTLNACGLKTHEHVPACVKQEVLGVQLDGERLEARVTRKRIHRLRIVIDWALKRGRLRGQELGKLLGHCTFVGLLRRPCLSVFSSCYKLIRATYAHTTRLWRSVSAELRAFRGLLPLMYVLRVGLALERPRHRHGREHNRMGSVRARL